MNTQPSRRLRSLKLGLALASALVVMTASAASAGAFVTYNNIPVPAPGNLPSVGFEATSAAEFGGAVDPAGFLRRWNIVTVGMSSWGCESGAWYSAPADPCVTSHGAHENVPITLNAYNLNADNSVGSLITSVSTNARVPYRPSSSAGCTDGRWKDRQGKCNNGMFFTVTFPMIKQKLPSKVVFTVTYNTSHYGPSPLGQQACFYESGGCIYDSLNVAISDPAVTQNNWWNVGTAPLPNDIYWNSSYNGNYCDNGAGGTGTLRRDAGCWTGYQPIFNVVSLLP